MQFLSIFRNTWWLKMSKMLKKEKLRCSGGFVKQIKAICVEKNASNLTETDKILENSDFWNFYAIFVYFSKNWWPRMLKTFNKEQTPLSWLVLLRDKNNWCWKKASNFDRNWQKRRNSNFEHFMQFLCNFGESWWLRFSKTLNKEQIGCQEGFFEEINEVFLKKTHNLRPKMTIVSKCTDFSRFHATFVKFLKISWIRTVNTFNHDWFGCPIGLFPEINAVL